MKKISHFFSIFILISNVFLNLFTGTAYAVDTTNSLDASQFVSSVSVSDANGPIGTNKISDSSSINVNYNLTLGDGKNIDTTQPYTMPLPKELNYETTKPISLDYNGVHLGDVTIKDGVIYIQFSPEVSQFENLSAHFNFWSGFNKDELDYDNGNDMIFPTQSNPDNSVHINFSKSGSGGGSGTSAISKSLTYDDTDPTIVNWSVTVNNGGYAIDNSVFKDVMENNQDYIPGSMTINYRNWNRAVISSETKDPTLIQQSDGSQTFSFNFGQLKSVDEKDDSAVTSIVIRYKTKLLFNAENNRYPNTAYSYDGDQVIDHALSTATYRGQGGGGEGDQVINISGTKTWDDQENAFNSRPQQIELALLRNDVNYKQTQVSEDQDGNWKYSFNSVPKFDSSGNEYRYSIKELNTPDGYVSEVNGNDIINHYQASSETIDVAGEKVWDDGNNQDGKRPTEITVNLLANDEIIKSQKVTRETNWQYSFTDLPKFEEGKPVTYRVTENPVEGYTTKVDGTTITNTYKPETKKISVSKIWNDQDNQDGLRTNSVKVELLSDGKVLDQSVLNNENKWQTTWTNLPKFSQGKEINYNVREVTKIAGYTIEISNKNPESFVITNTHIPESITIKGEKIWNDKQNQQKIRPNQIAIQLFANGKAVLNKNITSADNWKYEITNLPKYSQGKVIDYSIKEKTVAGYSSKIEGFNIVNTLTAQPESIELKAMKTWKDNNDKKNIRPNAISVQLYANNQKSGSPFKITKENGWKNVWNNLPKNDSNGKEIIYTLKEIDIPEGYTSSIKTHGKYEFEIINRYREEGRSSNKEDGNSTKKNEKNNSPVYTSSSHKKYPATGEKSSIALSFLGISLIAVSSAVYLFITKRK